MLKLIKTTGFTIAELLVIITVIGILASVVSVSYIGWQKSARQTQVKNDLIAAFNAMESELNFSDDGYPSGLPDSFTKSADVEIQLSDNSSASSFCIEASHEKDNSIKFHITQSGNVAEGQCPNS